MGGLRNGNEDEDYFNMESSTYIEIDSNNQGIFIQFSDRRTP